MPTKTTGSSTATAAKTYPAITNRTGSDFNSTFSGTSGANKYAKFAAFAIPRNYNIARSMGLGIAQAKRAASFMTMQQANESGYGTSRAFVNGNNRSGFRVNDRNLVFDSHDQNDISLQKSFMNHPNWIKAMQQANLKNYIYTLQNPNAKIDTEKKYEGEKNAATYYNEIFGQKTMQKAIDQYFNSGAADDWTYYKPEEGRRILEFAPILIG